MTTASTLDSPWSLDSRRLVLASAIAAGVNLALFAVGSASGATWATSSPMGIGPLTVAGATLVPLLAVGAVVGSLAARRPNLPRLAARAGLAFGVLGAPIPFLASSDLATSVSLAPMHVVAGLAWFLAVRSSR